MLLHLFMQILADVGFFSLPLLNKDPYLLSRPENHTLGSGKVVGASFVFKLQAIMHAR
jgi:hypothetical protein